MRVARQQIEVLLDAAEAGLELADEDAVADDRGMILDHGAAEPDDLLAELLADSGDLPARLV